MSEPQIEIILKDNTVRTFPQSVTPVDIAKSVHPSLASKVLSARLDEKTIEPLTPLQTGGKLSLYTWDDDEGKKAFWHSSAHLLAQAMLHYYPKAKLTIGPAIEEGFYYDVDFGDDTFSEKEAEKIEKKMLEFASQKSEFRLFPISKADALSYYKERENPYKVELIEGLEDGDITFCTHADFTDLCRGGHIRNTGFVKAVKVTKVAGAYWRGDENRLQLTRIYGVSFPQKKLLIEYIERMELAKQRDHRKIGKELGIFTFSENVGAGLPLWLPRGVRLREKLETFMREKQRSLGYEMVATPHIGHKKLYETSGHYEMYKEDSFRPMETPSDGEVFMLKPMNCPHHCEIYKSQPRSYRDLPVRYAEFGTVYRYEQSGELHGLTRVRGFTQDDAHLFCRPEQLLDEFINVIDLVGYVFEKLGFDTFTAQISLRSQEDKSKYIGDDAQWEEAEQAIITACEKKGLPTVIEYGEAAFYGPKLDFMIKDMVGRQWQLGTIQVDYNLPNRFKLEYVDHEGEKRRPVMIHRAPFGSLERFVAILIEHTGGDFPLWLSPTPFIILPISDVFHTYAHQVEKKMKSSGMEVYVDTRNEKIGKKIRDAETQKYKYMLVVGQQEVDNQSVNVRKHKEGNKGSMSLENFLKTIGDELIQL